MTVKGISNIISIVLLVMVTICLVGFSYIFFIRTVSISSNTSSGQVSSLTAQATECIKLDSADSNKLYIRNCGTAPIKNSSINIYIDNTPVQFVIPGDIEANGIGIITITDNITSDIHSLKMTSLGPGLQENVVMGSETTTSTTSTTTTTVQNIVSSCSSIDLPGAYVLSGNISSAGNCIVINSSDVTLDCQGYAINYSLSSTGQGITINGYNNTRLVNCKVLQTGNYLNSHSFYLRNSKNTTLLNSTASTNWYDCSGLWIYDSGENVIANSSFVSRESYAAYLKEDLVPGSVAGNLIYNCLFNSSYGVFAYSSVTQNNNFNISKQPGQRIYSSGTQIGGNYYTDLFGYGYSDSCSDSDADGFCDSPFDWKTGTSCLFVIEDAIEPQPCGNNADFLPLRKS
jgi:flagellin-like protein